ncbi:MAG: cytochrome D1 domain-containing protein [Desulfosarcinaceae bacterium]
MTELIPLHRPRISWNLICAITVLCVFMLSGCGGGGGGGDGDSGPVDQGGMTIYVSGYHPQDPDLGGVAAVNAATGSVSYLRRSAGEYLDVAVSPNGQFVVFTEYNTGAIFVYDTGSHKLVYGLTEAGAFGIAMTSDSTYALVVSTNAEPTMTVCDLSALVLAEVAIETGGSGDFGAPTHIVLTPDESAAYISTGSFNYVTGHIAKVTPTTDDGFSFEPVYVGGDPSFCMAITADGRYLYFTSSSGNAVRKVDLENPDDVTAIPLEPATGENPLGIAISPDGRWVYTTSMNTGYVSIIDTATDEVVNTIKAGNMASDVAFTADGTKAYICSGDVYIIDCATQTLLSEKIDVGFLAYAVAIAE